MYFEGQIRLVRPTLEALDADMKAVTDLLKRRKEQVRPPARDRPEPRRALQLVK